MSGLEVIGTIAAVLQIIDKCSEIYDSAKKDLKLPEAFEVVARRLPILADTLQACKTHLESRKHSVAPDVYSALERTLDSCEAKARNLRTIFEKVIVQEGDGRMTRYKKIVGSLGKGNTVEELMKAITEDVQHVVNNDAVRSSLPEQSQKLEKILKDLQGLEPSLPVDNGPPIRMQNINSGSGQQWNYETMSGSQTFNVVVEPKVDLNYVKKAVSRMIQVPYFDQNLFVGRRSELDKIAEELKPNEQSLEQRRLVLGGMGGIGKTQLAIAYAHRYKTVYDSVLWLNATSEATLKSSFVKMAEAIIEMKDHSKLSSEQAAINVHHWLQAEGNSRWLLIYDNYDNPYKEEDPSTYDIKNYYPSTAHGSIIVTTRLPDQVHGRQVFVHPLDHVDFGLRILETRSQRSNIGADVHARDLAERLAGLPLALATAGTFLRNTPWTFQRYLEEYEKKWNITPRRPLQLIEYQRTLYTTWDLSYQHLEKDDPWVAQVLKLLAYFDHQGLWIELFQAGIQFGDNLPECLIGITSDSGDLEYAMQLLIEHCFLEHQPTTDRYSMHTCIHDWLSASLKKSVEPRCYWYAFDCVSHSIGPKDWRLLGYLRYAPLAAHATRLTHSRFREVGQLFTLNRLPRAAYLAELLHEQTQLAAAIIMSEQALVGHETILGPDHLATIVTVNNLGLKYTEQGRFQEAEQMYIRALAGFEKVSRPDQDAKYNTLNSLGRLYAEQGKLQEAEQMLMQALAGKEVAFGHNATKTLITVENVGAIYHKQGKFKEAKNMYLRALMEYEKQLGPDDPSTLTTVDNIGCLHRDQGELAQAYEMFMRALVGKEAALGPDHLDSLETVNNLGLLYTDQGRLEEAEEMFIRALAGREKALGPHHSSTLDSQHGLATLYRLQGRLDRAASMYPWLLIAYEQVLGDNHSSTMLLVNNFGLLYEDQGQYERAESMYRRALAGYTEGLGLEHWRTREAADNLARILCRRGQRKTNRSYDITSRGKAVSSLHHGTVS